MPSVIFGVTGLLAGVVALLLPETRDTEMVENISTIELRGKTEKEQEQVMMKVLRRLSQPHMNMEHKNSA